MLSHLPSDSACVNKHHFTKTYWQAAPLQSYRAVVYCTLYTMHTHSYRTIINCLNHFFRPNDIEHKFSYCRDVVFVQRWSSQVVPKDDTTAVLREGSYDF